MAEPLMNLAENHVQVRRFAGALGVAVYDKRIEQDRPLEFFFDADILLSLIAGPSEVKPGRQPNSRLLVRALLSSGYLGKLHVLRPHALEFDRHLRQFPSFTSVGQQQLFRLTVGQMVREWGLNQYDKAIAGIAAADEPEEIRVQRLLEFLRDHGYETFVGMELAAGGTWKHRLGRLWKNGYIRFREQEFDLDAMLVHEETRTFFKALAGQRQGSRWSINNLTDVLALRSLAEAIRQQPEKQVRFYTDTEALRLVLQEDETLLAALSYGVPSPETTILRDDDYFLIRASFAALAFPDAEKTTDPTTESELVELEHVSCELNTVLFAHGGNIDTYIASATVGGRKLAEVISEFETLNFVDRVWLTYRVPEPMRELLPGIVALYTNQSFLTATSHELDSAVEAVRRNVKVYVKDVQGWARTFETIQAAATNKQRMRTGTADPLPDPWRDLGLGRWGIDTEVADPDGVVDEIHGFLRDSGTDLDLRCATLAFRLGSKHQEPAELQSSYILLWFLELYQLLHDEFREVARSLDPHENAGLFILDSVAQMRTTDRGDLRAKQRIIESLRERVKKLPANKRGYGYMGLGYVCYWAWRDEVDGLGLYRISAGPPLRPVVESWARESYARASQAVKSLKPGTLARAFAVNHCAYVSSVANLGANQTLSYISQLGGIRNQLHLWHYRFEDTVAVHFTFQAIYAVRERGLKYFMSEEGAAERKQLCRLLTQGKNYLARAVPNFDDPEVLDHDQQVATLQARLGCDLSLPSSA